MSEELIKYSVPKSFVDASFFQKLSSLKLDTFKLDSTKKDIHAVYNIKSIPRNENPAISLASASFEPPDASL